MRNTLVRTTTIVAIAALCALAGPRTAAQGQQTSVPVSGSAAQPAAAGEPSSLKVEVVIARYEGDKKTSSLPFSLWVSTGNSNATSIRTGSEVPMPTATEGKAGVTYHSVGTSIDCRAQNPLTGKFMLTLSIQDSSLFAQEKTAQNSSLGLVSGYPVIRSFSSTNSLLLRDGQSAEYVMATDKVTGEVLKVTVTLTVVK